MSSKIFERITLAETRWLELLNPYVSKLFAETFLPSHDQGHHRRVWMRCKSLILELERFSTVADQDLVEGLLLASWFHDTGMVSDPGEMHGAHGREILERFIRESGMHEPARYKDVLNVIGYHDTKERSLYPELKPGKPPGMMGILSMADDLDALGIVGIYRYIEIYLKRGIPASLLGIKILSNVRQRFKNIQVSCASFPSLIDSYLSDYHLIEQFFNRYNQQLVSVVEPEKVAWGELGIVNHIRVFSLEAEVRPENFSDQPGIASSGSCVKTYFKRLHDELGLPDC